MKTLSQVEPRTAITNAPYTITQPGSYYLTSNLTSAGHGVIIRSDRVTLELMGFTLSGDRSSSDYGIWVDGAVNAARNQIVVRGGSVKGFDIGIFCDYMASSRIDCLMVSSNLNHGVLLGGSSGGPCNGNVVENCIVGENGANGIQLNGGQPAGRCNGNTIRHCMVRDNGSAGVFLYGGSGGFCDGNTVENCAVSDNSTFGIYIDGYLGQSDGNTVADCSVYGNGSFGVYLYGLSGQCDGNRVERCTLFKNTSSGVYVDYADGNRIQNNHITGTTGTGSYGIYSSLPSGANLIVQNTCVGQSSNFNVSTNDTCGPVVSSAGTLGTSGAAMSPWANFSR
jgi:parallel beta-helix repeat protein